MSDIPIPGLGNPNDKSLKEYVITTHSREDLDSLYYDMERDQGTNYIPSRAIHCCKRRPTSRNTHYVMTYQEAAQIMNDSRVQSVSITPKAIGAIRGRDGFIQTTSFNKRTASNSLDVNWGLLRSVLSENIPDWGVNGDIDKTGTVRSSLTGKNVDVVIMDDGCPYVLTLEYRQNADGTGYSRMVEQNWLAPSSYNYNTRRLQEHGSHTTGTVAGNTQGWARDANIYNLTYNDTNGEDLVRTWHLNKPVNPLTGFKNPTVMNNSWGYRVNGWGTGVTRVRYRGVDYNPSGSTFTSTELRNFRLNTKGALPLRDAPTDADFVDLMAAGVIVVASAGNSYAYVDEPGGVDYDNYIIRNSTTIYCHRGSSPGSAYGGSEATKVICVGSVGQHNESLFASIYDATGVELGDYKSEFSNYGPGIDVYAPGSAIQSIWNSGDSLYDSIASADPRASENLFINNFKKCPGTSMSGPQVAGILACMAERFPRWTQIDARRYITANCPETLQSTNGGVTDDADAGFTYSALSNKRMMLLKDTRFKPTTDNPFNSVTFPRNDESFYRPESGVLYPRRRKLVKSKPTFSLSSNKTNINQSESATLTLTTTGLSDGTEVPYIITVAEEQSVSLVDLGTSGVFDPDEIVPGINLDTRPNRTTEIITTGALSGTSQALTLETINVSGFNVSTTPDVAAENTTSINDDGYWEVSLPFSITFLDQSYSTVYVGTNGYITFGQGWTDYADISALNPPLPKIMISAGDRYGNAIYTQTSGSAGNRLFKLAGLWNSTYQNDGGNIRYQLTFSEAEPAKIIVTVAENVLWEEQGGASTLPVTSYVSGSATGVMTVNDNQATLNVTASSSAIIAINVRLGIFPAPNVNISLNQ